MDLISIVRQPVGCKSQSDLARRFERTNWGAREMSAQNDAAGAIKAHLVIIRTCHGRLPVHTANRKYYLMAENVYTRLRSPPAMPEFILRTREDLCLFRIWALMTITLLRLIDLDADWAPRPGSGAGWKLIYCYLLVPKLNMFILSPIFFEWRAHILMKINPLGSWFFSDITITDFLFGFSTVVDFQEFKRP